MYQKHVAILLPSLSGGGVASSILRIAEQFISEKHHVDLLVTKPQKKQTIDIPHGVNLIKLNPSTKLKSRLKALHFDLLHPGKWLIPLVLPLHIDGNIPSLPHLIQYLKKNTPDVLLSAPTYPNIMAILAKHLSRTDTKIVISEHSIISKEIVNKSNKWNWKYIIPLLDKTYFLADNIISVSEGIKDEILNKVNIRYNSLETVYNPVISEKIDNYKKFSVDHAWINDKSTPVILGVGRLLPEKDWPTLLRAFAQVRKNAWAKLIILGEGNQRENLEQLAIDLNIRDHIDLPGYSENPYAYMAKADVFALSSKYEGLGNVIIEALACGCPIVSTDCPSGPGEILQDGEYGRLVPVGDHETLSQAILKSLFEKPDTTKLRNRSWDFSVKNAYLRYRKIMLNE